MDLLGNSEVPLSDEERLAEYYDTTKSNNKTKMINKLSNSNFSSSKEKEKINTVIPGESIIKHLKG